MSIFFSVLGGIVKACEKRPVSIQQIDKLVDGIELQLYNSMKKEVSTEEIGEIIMTELKDLDQVAYVRFASVYRQFKDIDTFMEELTKIMKEK